MPAPFSTRFGVAVHVLTLLAADPPVMTSSELLAMSVGANPVHVRRVLSALGAAGLVRSRPGPSGGWELARPAAIITLRDAHAALAEGERVLGLHQAAPACPTGQRIQAELEAIARRAADILGEQLAQHTVADLVAAARVDGGWRTASARRRRSLRPRPQAR